MRVATVIDDLLTIDWILFLVGMGNMIIGVCVATSDLAFGSHALNQSHVELGSTIVWFGATLGLLGIPSVVWQVLK